MAENWKIMEQANTPFCKLVNPGDSVEGKLVAIRKGKFGDLYDIEQADKTVVTMPSKTFLSNRIIPEMIGKPIKIVFVGQEKSGTGRLFEKFEIYTK